jgi:predicted nucleic acid-binding protein
LGGPVSAELLLDNSAWARLDHVALSQDRVWQIAGLLEQGRIAACLPFLLEAGYSARNGGQHQELIDELLALPQLQIDARVELRAVDAQRQLARVGHHRLPPVDVIVAAIADINGLGILHYDADYELIAEKTDLRFDSVWLAERGSL